MAEKKGKGWHGDKEGHARAGRLGGLAKSSKFRQARGEVHDASKGRNETVVEEAAARREIDEYEEKITALRDKIKFARSGAEILTVAELDAMERELRNLENELEKKNVNPHEVYTKIHELGLRIHYFSDALRTE